MPVPAESQLEGCLVKIVLRSGEELGQIEMRSSQKVWSKDDLIRSLVLDMQVIDPDNTSREMAVLEARYVTWHYMEMYAYQHTELTRRNAQLDFLYIARAALEIERQMKMKDKVIAMAGVYELFVRFLDATVTATEMEEDKVLTNYDMCEDETPGIYV